MISRAQFLGSVMLLMVLGMCGLTESARSAPPVASAVGAQVKIDNFSFSPATITIAAGTTLSWVNRDDIPHTVVSTATPPLFKSKALDTDDTFAFKFEKPGTYPYFCSLHPKMTGSVIVR